MGEGGWEEGTADKEGKNEEERRERSNRVKKEIDKTEVHSTLYPDVKMQVLYEAISLLLSATVACVTRCDTAIMEVSLTFVH